MWFNCFMWCLVTLKRVSSSSGSSMHVLYLLIYLNQPWSMVYSPRRLGLRNYVICHCRAKGHSFVKCPRNVDAHYASIDSRSISWWKKTVNKGQLFLCHSNNCGFWVWIVIKESSGQSSSDSTSLVNPTVNKWVEDMEHMFQSRVMMKKN